MPHLHENTLCEVKPFTQLCDLAAKLDQFLVHPLRQLLNTLHSLRLDLSPMLAPHRFRDGIR